jgi:hypothetical protein
LDYSLYGSGEKTLLDYFLYGSGKNTRLNCSLNRSGEERDLDVQPAEASPLPPLLPSTPLTCLRM